MKKSLFTFLLAAIACQSLQSIEPFTVGAATLATWGTIKGYKWQKRRKLIWDCFNAMQAGALDALEEFPDETLKSACDEYAREIFRASCERDSLILIQQLAKKDIFLEKLSSTALHDACAAGSIMCAAYCIDHGLDIEVRDSKGRTALMVTAGAGDLDGIDRLANKLYTKNGSFSASGPIEMCRGWIESRKQLDTQDNYYEIVQLLLSKGAFVDTMDEASYKALHYAVIRGNKRIVSLLMSEGVSTRAKNNDGLTPLDWAVICDDTQMQSDLLLMRGEFSAELSTILINLERNEEAQRIENYRQAYHEVRTDMASDHLHLHFAVAMGLEKLVHVFIEKKQDVNHIFRQHHETPLHFGAYSSRRSLLVYYWNKSPHILSYDPAVIWGPSKQSIKKLLQEPLEADEQKLFSDILIALLDEGADIDTKNKVGWTALHIAAAVGNIEAVRLLIARGAHSELKDTLGKTAADWAEEIGHTAIAQVLSNQKESSQ